ncbi:hypothetical protein COY16_03090 [Candidatus Roizmanbacteria bacterium CG_4_10_14_0_2_um_filter_39_13]|uniref:Ferric oxidoreductase domain-containing protein n=1 Tax=Candidatus Roizmanbacteria bacterium CG_4_10_14_0_2_um_filter_39_13 TaxID=1974825 RepID=A0A2M7TYW8_9BACT|nr:MAG: hypothetical protein COY16_03090 [Candidatus Roizmanbacteria bacterium CG_4_10_14_0_2_um_filter_39_13]
MCPIINTMSLDSNTQSIFQFFAKHKKTMILVFYGQYMYIVGMIGYSAYLISLQTNREVVYEWGTVSGVFALVYFSLSMLPGIARRFKLVSPITQILMLFRRQVGVTAFLFGLFHYLALRMLPIVLAGVPLNLNPPVFEILGFLTLYPMTLLFLTSNDLSVKKMGVWWRRVHSLAYIMAWTIFLHVALNEAGLWTVVIGIFALLETSSLVYFFFKRKSK